MINVKRILALALAVIFVFSLSGCLKYTDNIFELTTVKNQGFNNPQYDVQTTTQNINNQQTLTPQPDNQVQTTQPQNNTLLPETTTSALQPQETTTSAPAVSDPSTWTVAEILKFTTDAVTKTKAYNNTVTVDHSEAFDVKITKAPGGKLIMDAADGIIASVAKPSQETLTFNGGKTVNGEGETVPLLLPKRGAFTLTADGIASATAKKSGNDTIVHIQLVQEVGTLTDHPKYHAASVGYLDSSDVDLGSIKLNYLDITYSGTTMDYVINSDGYVSAVDYKIPIHIAVEAKVVGITAAGECEGSQSESWKINW